MLRISSSTACDAMGKTKRRKKRISKSGKIKFKNRNKHAKMNFAIVVEGKK